MECCWMESFQPSTCDRVSAVRRQVLAWLRPFGVSDDIIEDVALALTEACANAVEHGSPRGAGDSFHVRCRVEADVLRLEVIDHGHGFPFRGIRRPDPLALEERGRGIWLMSAVTDRLFFRHERGGTQVLIEKDLRAPLPSE